MSNCRNFFLVATVVLALATGGPSRAASSDWQQKVTKLIAAGYSYPRSAQKRGVEGVAKVKITISGAGKVLAVELVQATGSAILDREAVRIPMKVGTFPVPPNGSDTNIIVPITWRLK